MLPLSDKRGFYTSICKKKVTLNVPEQKFSLNYYKNIMRPLININQHQK